MEHSASEWMDVIRLAINNSFSFLEQVSPKNTNYLLIEETVKTALKGIKVILVVAFYIKLKTKFF